LLKPVAGVEQFARWIGEHGRGQVGGHPGAVWRRQRLWRWIAPDSKALGPGAGGVARYARALLNPSLAVTCCEWLSRNALFWLLSAV